MRRLATDENMGRFLIVVGVLTAVAFWVFLLTGHGEGTGLLGVMAFVLTILGIVMGCEGNDEGGGSRPGF